MKPLLVPGVQAPEFALLSTSGDTIALSSLRGKPAVLVFFPAEPDEATVQQLGKFQERRADLEAAGAALVAVSPAEPAALAALASAAGLTFPLLHDAGGAVAAAYGAPGLPAVFVLDDAGVVRRVYDPEGYPSLPNPAMVVRAVAKLAETPRAAPVCAEDWVWGPADAPVTLVEYADYQCVPCGETFRVLQEVLPRYQGQVRLIFRHLPIRITHPLAQGAAEAAEAAGAQGKFWEMHTCLFEARGDLARGAAGGVRRASGAGRGAFRRRAGGGAVQGERQRRLCGRAKEPGAPAAGAVRQRDPV